MSDPLPAPDAPRREAAERRAAIGLALIGLGVLGILWGVFHLLNALPEPQSLDFAHRTTDYQNRKVVHEELVGTVWRGLLGLLLALYGGRLRGKAQRELGKLD